MKNEDSVQEQMSNISREIETKKNQKEILEIK